MRKPRATVGGDAGVQHPPGQTVEGGDADAAAGQHRVGAGLGKVEAVAQAESTSSSVPGTQRTSSQVPSPTTFTSSIRAPSSVQLQMEMGRRRNLPGS